MEAHGQRRTPSRARRDRANSRRRSSVQSSAERTLMDIHGGLDGGRNRGSIALAVWPWSRRDPSWPQAFCSVKRQADCPHGRQADDRMARRKFDSSSSKPPRLRKATSRAGFAFEQAACNSCDMQTCASSVTKCAPI